MKRKVIALLVATALLGLDVSNALAQEWIFVRARAIDGDTIRIEAREIGELTVHLDGIDAIESKQRCGPGRRETAEWSCGLTAHLHLVRLFEERGLLRCRLVGRHEDGLPLAECNLRGGLSVSYEMAKEGLALALPDADEALRAAQQDARTNDRGIWQGPFDAPWDWRRDNPGT